MDYRKGDRVKHPTKDDWGLGEVLENSNGESVRVFFVGAGEKLLSLKYVKPVRVVGAESSHIVLDNLRISKSPTGLKYQSLTDSVQYFLEQFPEGFYGEKFQINERDYKVKANALAQELLSSESFRQLLESGNYSKIVKRALRLVNATNLIFPNEKMALKDGLVDADARKSFAEVLFLLLHGEGDFEKRFMAFASFLEEIDSAKWTTATYFLFIMHPDKYMFVKPTITQYAGDLCGFELNYKPQLNWLTYKSVLKFSEYLHSELTALAPRDMIDIQSFMWCIAPGTYKDA